MEKNILEKINAQLLGIEVKLNLDIALAIEAIKKDMESKLVKELVNALEENRELKRTIKELSKDKPKDDHDDPNYYDSVEAMVVAEREESDRESYRE